MKFEVKSSFWTEEEITKQYPCLADYNMKTDTYTIRQGKLCYSRTKIYIELSTLEDILELTRKVDAPLIICDDNSIEIYDGYRE